MADNNFEQVNKLLNDAKAKYSPSDNATLFTIELGAFLGDGTFANVYDNKACENEVVKVIDIAQTLEKTKKFQYVSANSSQKQELLIKQKNRTKGIIITIQNLIKESQCAKKYLVDIHDYIILFDQKDLLKHYFYVRMEKLRTMDYYPMDFHEATYVDMMLQLCYGIKALHDHDLIHTDIKPDNIFVKELSDGKLRFKIGDYGMLVKKAKDQLYVKGIPLKTEFFAPPEAKEGIYGYFSDIYSLGVSIHYMANGGYKKNLVMNLVDAFYGDDKRQRFERIHKCSDEFARILQKCIHKDYSERYQHIEQLIDDLKQLQIQLNEKVVCYDFNSDESQARRKQVLALKKLFLDYKQKFITKGKGVFNYLSAFNIFKQLPEKQEEKKVMIENDKKEDIQSSQEVIEYNKLQSLSYCLRQSEIGNIYAINNLGCMYASGNKVKKDYQKAVMYFKMIEDYLEEARINLQLLKQLGVDIYGKYCANLNEQTLLDKAQKEDVDAMYQLVHYYFAKEKYDKAMPWLMKASAKQDYLSMQLLEQEYRSGSHMPQDLYQAQVLKMKLEKMKRTMDQKKIEFKYIKGR